MKAFTKRVVNYLERDIERFIHLLAAALAGLLILMVLMEYSISFGSPTITMKGAGTIPEGSVREIVVKLADPSLLDRFMASLPELPSVLMTILAFAYLMWSDALRAKGVVGAKDPKVMNQKSAVRKLVGNMILGSVIVSFILASPTLTSSATATYFDTTRSMEGAAGIPLAFLALLLVITDSFAARVREGREHKRADILNEKMQDVV